MAAPKGRASFVDLATRLRELLADLPPEEVRALLPTVAALALAAAVRANDVSEPSPNSGPLITVEQAASILGTSRQQVWRLSRRHDWRAFVKKLGVRSM